MPIYHLYRNNVAWNEYQGMIIRAKNPKEAKLKAEEFVSTIWLSNRDVKCRRINDSGPSAVILGYYE